MTPADPTIPTLLGFTVTKTCPSSSLIASSQILDDQTWYSHVKWWCPTCHVRYDPCIGAPVAVPSPIVGLVQCRHWVLTYSVSGTSVVISYREAQKTRLEMLTDL